MKRRDFIVLLGAAVAWPLAARTQQPAMPVVGYLGGGSPSGTASDLRAFWQGLAEAGFVEGRNVAFEYRWADGQPARLASLAADLVRHDVMAIVSGTEPAARAARAATAKIPIIFSTAGDPIKAGLVASLNRPGGNLTGVATLSGELMPKKLEFLHEAVPMVSTITVLINPVGASSGNLPVDVQAAADAIGLRLEVAQAGSEEELETTFTALGRRRDTALVIPPNALFLDRRELLGALSLRYGIPAVHTYREFAEAGGLMSYGGDRRDTNRVVGTYVGRILKGEKPAELPVQQSTKVELIINLKTAKALGLTVPLPLLGRADEVIE